MVSVGLGGIINVPSENDITIQEGIDMAQEDDTVLVAQGTYNENLIIDKNITLASHAIDDDLTNWTERNPDTGEFEVLNENILSTIIDGSDDTNGEQFQSVILINSTESECIEPTIVGFTITGGDGTATYEMIDDDTLTRYRGGGIFSNNALPELHYNYFIDNDGEIENNGIYEGGAYNSGTGVDLGERFGAPSNNFRCGGEINLSNNFYRDNEALFGNSLATTDFEGSLDMTNSIFDIYNCPDTTVSRVWVDVEEEVEIDFENSSGDQCSTTEDVWVSPNGDDYFNTGTSPDNAFLTIRTALEMIYPTDDNPITINLTEGTFSPSITGETFPIVIISNINITGQSENTTKLDAEDPYWTSGGGGIFIDMVIGTNIAKLTITGADCGYNYGDGCGIKMINSNVNFTNVTIKDNNNSTSGAGILIDNSTSNLTNVIIQHNSSSDGSIPGMYVKNSSISFIGGSIINNHSPYAFGGLVLSNVNTSFFQDIDISFNTCIEQGAAIAVSNSSDITFDNIIVSNNVVYIPNSTYGGIIDIWGSNNVTIKNSLINNNGSPIHDAATITLISENTYLTNLTMVNNTGEAVIVADINNQNGFLTNSIIWGNNSDVNDIDFGFSGSDEDILTINYSNIEGGCEGEGNIDSDPLFFDPDNENYTLQYNSPCIDAGTNYFEWNHAVIVDIPPEEYADGNGDGIPIRDIGVFEFVCESMVIDDCGICDGDNSSCTIYGCTDSLACNYMGDCVEFDGGSICVDDGTCEFEIDECGDCGGSNDCSTCNSDDSYVCDNCTCSGCTDPEAVNYDSHSFFEDGSCFYEIYTDVWVSPDGDDFQNSGTSIDDPFLTIQHALRAIAPTELNPLTIYLAEGQYSQSTNGESFPIPLHSNLHLKGSGEALTILDAEDENRVITMFNSENSIISNLSITGGNSSFGGGIRIIESNPILHHLHIFDNTAKQVYSYSEVEYTGSGGGIYIQDSNPELIDVIIENNSADLLGGGLFIISSSPIENNSHVVLKYVTIEHNVASVGAGICSYIFSRLELYNSSITANIAITGENGNGGVGGGIFGGLSNIPVKIINTTISDNIADVDGGGIYMITSIFYIVNSILWNNNPYEIQMQPYDLGSWSGPNLLMIANSDIKGGQVGIIDNGFSDIYWEPNNIDADPLFVDPENDDYNLQEYSPCINSGTITFDWEGTFINGNGETFEYNFELDPLNYCGPPDIGAYEYIIEDCEECDVDLADVNGDGEINILDLVQIVNYILGSDVPPYACAADYNEDGEVNILDLVQIANYILNPQ